MAEEQQQQQKNPRPRSNQMVKTATAATAGGSLLVLSGLTMAGTVVALAIATPLFVIFSPVLVPAAIATALLVTGFVFSGGFAVGAIAVLSWMYRYVTGRQSAGPDQWDQGRMMLGSKARAGDEGQA